MNLDANQLIAQSDSLLISRTIDMPAGFCDREHAHPWHQIIYPMRGTLRTKVRESLYFVPGNIAVFIPANTRHSSVAISNTRFIGIYFSPAIFQHECAPPALPQQCQLLQLSPFLKHFVAEIAAQSQLNRAGQNAANIRLYKVFCEQILAGKQIGLTLTLPHDKRLLHIADIIGKNPANKQTLDQLAHAAGVSGRTASRLFPSETGMNFRQWRQRMRLLHSLPMLEESNSVEHIAFSLGYESTSAFVYAFRNQFGITPGKFSCKP